MASLGFCRFVYSLARFVYPLEKQAQAIRVRQCYRRLAKWLCYARQFQSLVVPANPFDKTIRGADLGKQTIRDRKRVVTGRFYPA